jgi:hypothetical protein
MPNQARASTSTSTQGITAASARGDDGTASEASLLSCEFIVYLVRTASALVSGRVKLHTAGMARDRAGSNKRPRDIHSRFSVNGSKPPDNPSQQK